MEIVIKDIGREVVSVYAGNRIAKVGTGDNYYVSFLILIDGQTIDSELTIEYDGDLSFDKAEEIIRSKFARED